MSFRTSLVHSCFSIELSEPQPRNCRCRKLVTRQQAVELVNQGAADWIIDYSGGVPIPTWNICYRGRVGKTPRAHTLETCNPVRAPRAFGQIERGIDFKMNHDEGQMARQMDAAVMGDHEQMELFEFYHDLEMESRYRLFRGTSYLTDAGEDKPVKEQTLPEHGNTLLDHKKFSDTLGTVEGAEAKYVEEIVRSRADEIKIAAAVRDPYEGRTLFPMIGWDQRTKH